MKDWSPAERLRIEAAIADRPGQMVRLEAIADGLAEHDRQVSERVWDEGWQAGFRDMQSAEHEDDGYLVITPRPNPYRLIEEKR